MLGRIRREAENITINRTGILGVQSISTQYESVARPLDSLGITEIQYAPQGAQTASLQLNTLLTHTLEEGHSSQMSLDVMQNLTGNIPFSGIIDYGAEKIYFSEGYLETYSVSCGIGEVPQTSTTSTIFGDFGTGVLFSEYAQGPGLIPSLNIPSYSSMEVNLDEFSSNRMTSFSVDIATPRIPIYTLNADKPAKVIAGTPIEVNVNFSLDIDDYKIKNMRFVPDETVFRNATITLKKNNSDTTLLSYSFDNMLLTSESFKGGAESNAVANFNLRSFILR
ncbi:MAG TPA: hypothetical protein EYN67_18875 [Flavobacteriales bacterium]|nr:hypothetical protein [Flavobacteriales bacterium]